jgi:hypothetical protein
MSNFGSGTAAVDSMDNLTDGTGPDNIWSAYRVNVLKDGVLAVQSMLVNGDITFPDLQYVTSQLNARWFGSLEHTDYYKKTDEIDADSLNGQSDYWRVATSYELYQGICIDQKTDGPAYSFVYTFPTPFTQFVTLSHYIPWYQSGAGGKSPGDIIAQFGDGWDVSGYETQWLPYYPSSGGVVFCELRAAMWGIRWTIGSYGITGEHRAFLHVRAKGI